MSIIEEIVNFILERFNSCLAEVLQAIEDVLEDVKENKVIKKKKKLRRGVKNRNVIRRIKTSAGGFILPALFSFIFILKKT